jgi:hypothetical protein
MAVVNKEFLVKALHTYPRNDGEIGFNSAIIMILKRLADVDDTNDLLLDDELKLKTAINNDTLFYSLNKAVISDIIMYAKTGSKLNAVKSLKEATGLLLKDSKDVIDMFTTL